MNFKYHKVLKRFTHCYFNIDGYGTYSAFKRIKIINHKKYINYL